MDAQTDWILVKASVLPEVYSRVVAAQSDLAAGRCRSVSEATRLHGISRSAYYKYRDAVAPYVGRAAAAPTLVVELLLQDCPGVLSGLLSAFARAGANIITVNQQSPVAGRACVSVCAQTESMSLPLDLFAEQLGRIPGVQQLLSIRRQAGLPADSMTDRKAR